MGARKIGAEQEASLREQWRAAADAQLADHCVAWAAAQGVRVSRAMIGALDDVGQREGTDYVREHMVAPRVYADFAWPERRLAAEGHGTAHEASFFASKGLLEREARRAEVYVREGWTVRSVTWRELREQPPATRERL